MAAAATQYLTNICRGLIKIGLVNSLVDSYQSLLRHQLTVSLVVVHGEQVSGQKLSSASRKHMWMLIHSYVVLLSKGQRANNSKEQRIDSNTSSRPFVIETTYPE